MTIEQLFQNLLGASPLLAALAPFWFMLKSNITKDLVSKDELEKIIHAFKMDVERDQKDDKEYLKTLDKRTQENAKSVEGIKGRLEAS